MTGFHKPSLDGTSADAVVGDGLVHAQETAKAPRDARSALTSLVRELLVLSAMPVPMVTSWKPSLDCKNMEWMWEINTAVRNSFRRTTAMASVDQHVPGANVCSNHRLYQSWALSQLQVDGASWGEVPGAAAGIRSLGAVGWPGCTQPMCPRFR